MKVAPVSGDMLIKLAIGAAVVGVAWWAVRRGQQSVADAIDYVTSLPERAIEAVAEVAREGGATWQGGYTEKPPTQQEYFGKYQSPMVNDQGMDFNYF
jgi:hypothetical protein